MKTLWYGGRVRTLVSPKQVEEAIVTEEGKVIAVGQETDLRARFAISEEIKVDGVIYPGFVDSHLHMVGHGEKLLKLDVSELTSIRELVEELRVIANDTPKGEWILAEGFNENLYEGYTLPDKEVLDNVSVDHPIMVTRVCRHAMVTNSTGLKLAGITANTDDIAGGVIVRDDHGEPTGYLHDQAQELLKEVLPKKDRAYVGRALRASVKDLLSKGFTGGHTEDLFYYDSPTDTLDVFNEVLDETPFRTNMLVHHEAAEEILSLDEKLHEHITLGSVKIFADGALGGRTAYLSEPYADDPSTHGVAIHSQEGLNELVRYAREKGMPVAIHVIGDQALEMAIIAIERYPVPVGKRDRLIHLQVTREELVERLKQLPVILDIQPRFVASDFPWVEERLGERAARSFAWKSLLDEGIICAGGSDAPIEPIEPMLGLHAAVTRRRPFEQHPGYNPDQKLSVFESLRLFTYGSAQAISKEEEYGLIKPGYHADFTILSHDLEDLEPDEWLKVHVEKTVIGGEVAYEAHS
ncbi:amidohydrolase [Paenalkalicoccus suaedae]|uniref:Amidohydrolase n=1 Tax=Paenalkalicoccus suaedae TaxID=2592382 RepID=A0A859FFD5_9BACI|nr:amidohydrolase [Paenalkalicoccus suaedae]QKS72063.1 amidohydrolase [Paenalkalicoccus suaedae]